MPRSRLHMKFLWSGVGFTIAGGILAWLVHRSASRFWDFPWDFAVAVAVLVAVWLVPLWVALQRWVLDPLVRVQEADRRMTQRNAGVLLFPEKLIPNDEIGDLIRARNEMLVTLEQHQALTEKTAEQLRELYDAAREMVGLLARNVAEDELLRHALATTCRIVEARYGVIGLRNEAGEHVRFVYYGLTDEEAARIGDPPRGIGMLGKIQEYGRDDPNAVFIVNDLTKHPLHTGFPPHHPVMKTLLGLPIATESKVYGGIYLTEKAGGRPFTDEDASLVRSLAHSLAMTLEEKELREQLSASHQRYQELYDHAPVGLQEVDADGVITAMNWTLLSWLGYRRDEVIGRLRYEDLLTDGARLKFRNIAEACWRGEAAEDEDLELRRKDGTTFPVRISATPVFDQQGNVIAWRGTTRDVTREKELEQQLLQAQKLEAIGLLAGGVAHDFNNLLHVILGYTDLSRRNLDPSDPLHRNLSEIDEAAQRAGELVQRLLAFGRRQVLHMAVISVNGIVRELSKTLRRVIPETIELDTRVNAKADTVLADATSLEQIILNLVVNARDAMPEGGTLAIKTDNVVLDKVYCQRYADLEPGEYVCLTVADTGIGMDEETLARIFEPFFTTKEAGKGSGLGLSTVWGIVKQHKGHIEVSSKPGEGAIFKVYLPLHAAPPRQVAATEGRREPGGRETILVGEDDEMVRGLTRRILEQQGYVVLEARDGAEAVQRFAAHRERISLVILDLVMPKLGGLEAYERIRALKPHVPAILITGHSPGARMEGTGAQQGRISLLRKPFTADTLGQKVREVLDRPCPE